MWSHVQFDRRLNGSLLEWTTLLNNQHQRPPDSKPIVIDTYDRCSDRIWFCSLSCNCHLRPTTCTEDVFSVVIPTYNRKPILEKCLRALEQQRFNPTHISGYEVVVVDDGSTDSTVNWLQARVEEFPHVRLFQQNHQGPAAARNLGVEKAAGDTIIFIDSDLVVTDRFLQAHAEALLQAEETLETNRLFTYGRVINTCNFENPTSGPIK